MMYRLFGGPETTEPTKLDMFAAGAIGFGLGFLTMLFI